MAAPARVNIPRPRRPASRVDRQNHSLRTEFLAQLRDQLRTSDRSSVDAHFVCARVENRSRIIDASNAAADRQRYENLLRSARDDIHHRLPIVARRGDIEKHQLIRALIVVPGRKLHRIARVAQVHKIHALHHAAGGDIEARNDSLG